MLFCVVLKAADPNHLVLGVKWNGMPNKLSLAVETSDVVSMDWYKYDIPSISRDNNQINSL